MKGSAIRGEGASGEMSEVSLTQLYKQTLLIQGWLLRVRTSKEGEGGARERTHGEDQVTLQMKYILIIYH